MLDLGFAGWMADFGEYTPVEARTQFPARWWGEDRGGNPPPEDIAGVGQAQQGGGRGSW